MSVQKPQRTATRTPAANASATTSHVEVEESTIRGFAQVRTQMNQGADRTLAGEQIKQYMDAFNKARAEDPSIKLLAFDRNSQNTLISCILVIKSVVKSNGTKLAAVTALVLEASNPKLPTRTLQIVNGNIEVPSVTADAFNEKVREKVKALVSAQFPDSTTLIAGGQVVTVAIQPTDESRIQRAYSYAIDACNGVINSNCEYQFLPRINVNMLDDNERIYARVDQNNTGVESGGIPVRSDLSISVYTQMHGASNTDTFNSNTTPVVLVDTFVELLFTPPDADTVANAMATNNDPRTLPLSVTQALTPIINISQITSEMGAETLEMRLLGIHASTILAVNNAWATAFVPRLNRANTHLRDFGSLAYELTYLVDNQPGVKIDTQSNNFTDDHFATVLRKAVKTDAMYFRLWLEDNGQMSWLDNLFYLSTLRDDKDGTARAAKQLIFNACNALTGGNMADYWNVNDDVCYDDDVRIPLGVFKDGHTNRMRPTTDVDYISLLTQYGESELEYVKTYDTDINDKVNLSQEQRYLRTLQMYDHVFGGQYEVKGTAYTVTFNNEWLAALSAALEAAKYGLTPVNLNVNLTPVAERGQGRIKHSGFNAGLTGGIARQGGSVVNRGPMLPNSLRRRYG